MLKRFQFKVSQPGEAECSTVCDRLFRLIRQAGRRKQPSNCEQLGPVGDASRGPDVADRFCCRLDY